MKEKIKNFVLLIIWALSAIFFPGIIGDFLFQESETAPYIILCIIFFGPWLYILFRLLFRIKKEKWKKFRKKFVKAIREIEEFFGAIFYLLGIIVVFVVAVVVILYALRAFVHFLIY